MAKLVIGTNKQTVIPAIVRDKSPAHYIEKINDNGTLKTGSNLINLNGITDIGTMALAYAYYGVSFLSNTNIDLSSLTTISGNNACQYTFYSCKGITNVDLSSLTTIKASYAIRSCFYNNIHLVSADLSSLTTVSGSYAMRETFQNCTNLTSVDLSSLTYVYSNGEFFNCFAATGLTSVSLDSFKLATSVSQPLAYMFTRCPNLKDIYFKAFSGNNNNINTLDGNFITGVDGCTLHFPKNLDPQTGSTIISSMTGYPNFGGTNTVLAFDLPSANILTGIDTVEYERNPKYDTATALAWRVKDTGTAPDIVIVWTPYYTSGTTDPQVSDTIYSDSACTVAVTTIGSIA